MRKITAITILLFSTITVAQTNPYRLPKLNCSNAISCWTEIKNQVQHFDDLDAKGEITTRIYSQGHQTPVVYIFMHGIYDGGKLFNFLLPDLFENQKNNVINLVLPGHGADYESGYDLSFTDWYEQTDRAMELAKYMGRDIIFVTHSIGSTLALDQILNNHPEIKASVIVEPGLSVNLAITDVACVSQHAVKDARFLLPLARMFLGLAAADRPIPVHMGCEAGKVRDELFRRHLGHSAYIANNAVPEEVTVDYQLLAKRVNIPLLEINNEDDHVVVSTLNDDFYAALNPNKFNQYEALKVWKEPHGVYLVKHQPEFKNALFKFLSSLGL